MLHQQIHTTGMYLLSLFCYSLVGRLHTSKSLKCCIFFTFNTAFRVKGISTG